MRNPALVNGNIYHIFTKSIAGYRIFRSDEDYARMREAIKFYRYANPPIKLSIYLRMIEKDVTFHKYFQDKDHLVEIIAYCLMPTHIHLILKQLKDKGISTYMKNILDSYTRYFNTKNKRKGPLWQGRFGSVIIENDEYLLHLTRYIHLNPVSDNITETPENWPYSSYHEYINRAGDKICNISPYIKMDPQNYKKFVSTRKDYQRHLSEIKHLILE